LRRKKGLLTTIDGQEAVATSGVTNEDKTNEDKVRLSATTCALIERGGGEWVGSGFVNIRVNGLFETQYTISRRMMISIGVIFVERGVSW